MNRFQILKGEEIPPPLPEINPPSYEVSLYGRDYPARLNQITMFSHTNSRGRRADITVCIDEPDDSRFWYGSLCGTRINLLEQASKKYYNLFVDNVNIRNFELYGRTSLELDISAIIEKGDL